MAFENTKNIVLDDYIKVLSAIQKITQNSEEKKTSEKNRKFNEAISLAILIGLPTTIFFIFKSENIISILLERGAFNYENSILVSFSDAINISKKITNREERVRMINLIKSIKPKNFGVIVRTVTEKKSVSELDKDLKSLISSWKEGIKKIKKAKVGEKVLGEENKTTSLLRDILNSSFDNIIIDEKKLFNEVKEYVKKYEPKKEKIVKFYSSPAPIFEVYGIEKQLQNLFGETVPISNGGYVIIQHTEALHAIDVNSGKTSKVSNQEEAALKVNLDAVDTIARQLRLRDIGGIIVIDFIDLKKISNKRKLYEAMKKAMEDDRSKHTILPLSKFCLMQITRQRVRQELKMSKEDAELDQDGTEAADLIEKKIEHLFVKQNEKQLTLVVHPYLYSYFTIGVLSRQYKWFIKHRRWVKIEKDNNIGIKDYVFLDSNRQIIQTKK